MIFVDTSALVDALTGPRRSAPELRQWIERYEQIAISSLVLCEWLRGPRTAIELADQEALVPSALALPFTPEEAVLAATLYRKVRRPRGRELDLAIAASAIGHNARLWTLNPHDFADIPGLMLARA